jgi:hypothetical protein
VRTVDGNLNFEDGWALGASLVPEPPLHSGGLAEQEREEGERLRGAFLFLGFSFLAALVGGGLDARADATVEGRSTFLEHHLVVVLERACLQGV